MRVSYKPNRFYRSFSDPWSIGDAISPRYDRYRELLLQHARHRKTLLDLGCGYGAFLARFTEEFGELSGIDVSTVAVEGARERHPGIRFFAGSAAAPPAAIASTSYDVIVLSDVINYLPERRKRMTLQWIAEHLADDGIALIAGWSPGGRYLTPDEFVRLVDRDLVIEHYELMDSDHCVMIARRRRRVVVLTVDYETWQPIPEGRSIDWDADVFEPAEALLTAAVRADVQITLMAEMGEYLWLEHHQPALAERMREQWRAAVLAGHDVQLHLHPNWLPELGASFSDGEWQWDPAVARAADYPGDLTELIGRCRADLERTLSVASPDYRVSSFRAGTYEAQPFERLHDALTANQIYCDSSVLPGSHRQDRHYDYRNATALSGSWRANRFDPQLRAPAAEMSLLELPAYTIAPGVRWTFDGDEGALFAARLSQIRARLERSSHSSTELYRLRRRVAHRLATVRWPGARILGTRVAVPPPRPRGDDTFVLVGHTKGGLDLRGIETGMTELGRTADVECVTLTRAAELAQGPVAQTGGRSESRSVRSACDELLCGLMPLDRELITAIGGNAEDLPLLKRSMPWTRIAAWPHADKASALVLTDSLETCPDPDRIFQQARDALSVDGVLLCRVWADGRAGWRAPSASAYSSTRQELEMRLAAAGLVDVNVHEVDACRILGLPYRPESRGRLLLARAWRSHQEPTDRLRILVDSLYRRISPDQPSSSDEPREILAGGFAWCAGYAAVLAEALRREGFRARRVTLIAHSHPRGRGPLQRETHEVLEVWDGTRARVIDPMAGVLFAHSLRELLTDPWLAQPDRPPDGRWHDRQYDRYATEFFYRRVVRLGMREDPARPPRMISPEDLDDALPQPSPPVVSGAGGLPRPLLRAWWLYSDHSMTWRMHIEDSRARVRAWSARRLVAR